MKRLIICCDGTWQNSDSTPLNPTNITRLLRALLPVTSTSIPQIAYYQAGIGTRGYSPLSGATGHGLSENVREAYSFLSHNYSPGDAIHLFGFSRGAYTARSISALISRVGILTKLGMEHTFHDVYETYLRGELHPSYLEKLWESSTWVHRNVQIATVGCFDTVGALGVPGFFVAGVNARKFGFHDTALSKRVRNAYHALALDEKRKPFAPTLWVGNGVTRLRQTWFPGVHADIGGGYPDREVADMVLAWMVGCIQGARPEEQLEFDREFLREVIRTDGANEWAAGEVGESFRGLMRCLGGKVRSPGMGDNERVHISVRVREKVVAGWKCKALKGWRWDTAGKVWRGPDGRWVEEDTLSEIEVELNGKNVVEKLLAEAFEGRVEKEVKREVLAAKVHTAGPAQELEL